MTPTHDDILAVLSGNQSFPYTLMLQLTSNLNNERQTPERLNAPMSEPREETKGKGIGLKERHLTYHETS